MWELLNHPRFDDWNLSEIEDVRFFRYATHDAEGNQLAYVDTTIGRPAWQAYAMATYSNIGRGLKRIILVPTNEELRLLKKFSQNALVDVQYVVADPFTYWERD